MLNPIRTIIWSAIFLAGLVTGFWLCRLDNPTINQLFGWALSSELDYRSYQSVQKIYTILKDNYDGRLDDSQLLEGIKKGLTEAVGDPHTEYFNADQAATFKQELAGKFEGIGAIIERHNERLMVVSPLTGSPAAEAGLLPRDIILEVDGQPTADFTVRQAVSLIKGPAGTSVELKIKRSEATIIKITIVRAKIDLPIVEHRVENDIGILKIHQFSHPQTTQQAKQAAREFNQAQVKAVILDLRNNPGGYLDEALTISGLWLGNDQVVVEQRAMGRSNQQLRAYGNQELAQLPTVVLINAGSASASEIVAVALQDYQIATLIGQTSFGKGSVQTIKDLPDNEILKITTSRWFSPLGRAIDQVGVEPDIEIELPDNYSATDPDLELERAFQLLKEL